VGEDVYLLEGEIKSTGSAKYWYTYVKEGSVFQVEMTEEQARRAATEGWEVEAMTTQTSKKDEIIDKLNSAMGVINAKDDNMAEAIANMEELLKALKSEISKKSQTK
jgi:predicted transcriptional regulator